MNDKFWSKVAIMQEDDCWEWKASKNKQGYGKFRVDRTRTELAHRYAWELEHGFDPGPEFKVLHRCDNPSCVNHNHLQLGTQYDNINDMIRKNRRHSSRGSRNPQAKLSESDITAMRKSLQDGVPAKELAVKYEVTLGVVYRIRRRELWKHL